jgi:hypothetical protein
MPNWVLLGCKLCLPFAFNQTNPCHVIPLECLLLGAFYRSCLFQLPYWASPNLPLQTTLFVAVLGQCPGTAFFVHNTNLAADLTPNPLPTCKNVSSPQLARSVIETQHPNHVRISFLISTGSKLVDAIIEGVLSQDKAFFEGIVGLLLKKITQYWLKRPKRIVTTNFDPVLTTH